MKSRKNLKKKKKLKFIRIWQNLINYKKKIMEEKLLKDKLEEEKRLLYNKEKDRKH